MVRTATPTEMQMGYLAPWPRRGVLLRGHKGDRRMLLGGPTRLHGILLLQLQGLGEARPSWREYTRAEPEGGTMREKPQMASRVASEK
jgi:hypothetical protein